MISSIRTTCIGFQKSDEQETKCSFAFRATCLTAGTAGLTICLLIHFKVMLPYLAGTNYCFIGMGVAGVGFVGFCIKRVQKESVQESEEVPSEEVGLHVEEELDTELEKLRLIPDQLSADLIDQLPTFSEEQLKVLFPPNNLNLARNRLSQLSVDIFNAIMLKLPPAVLREAPAKFLLHGNFAWLSVSLSIAKHLFPLDVPLVKAKFDMVFNLKTPAQLNGILPHLHGEGVLALYELKKNFTRIQWNQISKEQILGICSFELSKEQEENFTKILEHIPVEVINSLLTKFPKQHLRCIPKKHLEDPYFKGV